MVDFHTHILPKMDDGSKDVEMSLRLLQLEKEQGVDTIVLTPHFYADENSPEVFLKRRWHAWERLRDALNEDAPRLVLGAEVQFFESMDRVESLHQLCIGGTDVMLLEMPFFKWDERVIHTVLDLQDSGQVRLVLAHIDRYLKMQPSRVWDQFREAGILMQVNADFFDGWFQKRKAMSMLKNGMIQLVGTDCHNLSSRKPDWEKVPSEMVSVCTETCEELLSTAHYM